MMIMAPKADVPNGSKGISIMYLILELVSSES